MRQDLKNIIDNPIQAYDVLRMFLDEIVGEGETRMVYRTDLIRGYVFKVDKENSWDNIREFEFWQAIKDNKDFSKWFAPSPLISGNGQILMQKVIKPITNKNRHKIPTQAPYVFTDRKESNYGFIGNQFVCCDYAFSLDKSLANQTKLKPFKFTH